MRLVQVEKSSRPNGMTRVTGIVQYNDGVTEDYWFELPDELHVCFRGADAKGQDHRNCGRCEKCYRTMIALDLFGKLDEATLFDRSMYDVKRISKIYISHDLDEKFFTNLHRTSIEQNRQDVAEQITMAMKRSRYIRKLGRGSKLPLLWRPTRALTKHLLRDAVK